MEQQYIPSQWGTNFKYKKEKKKEVRMVVYNKFPHLQKHTS